MSDSLESALIIELSGSFPWSAALAPLNPFTGTLTAVQPGNNFDVLQYARRDREFQHRDMINAAAVAKVSIFGRTIWNGTIVQPVIQGVTGVTDQSGTNVVLPLDPSQVGTSLPNTDTGVTYVLNADIPYASVTVTDVDLYNRDLMIYETLARAATLFPMPPINRIDPTGTYIGATSVWATAQGTNTPSIPNASDPLNQSLFLQADSYLAERDNQIAAYVAQVTQALQNPFEFATRIYVQVNATSGGDAEESETYVLTNNVFILGNTYAAGDQVLYQGSWYQAINTTTDTPPSANWESLSAPTQLQFLADPSLDSRNRMVYDTEAKTLQWFRETLDLVHVPQIVGFLIPGILPDQTIETVAAIPERKDAQFFRQKSARVSLADGTFASQSVFSPTGNRASLSGDTYTTGATATIFGNQKSITTMTPDTFTVFFKGVMCSSGTYSLNCLVRPTPDTEIAGGDNQQGSLDTTDGGTTYSAIGDVRNWEVPLPAGSWTMYIEFSNVSATPTTSFGIKASQGAMAIVASTLPIYYTDGNGNALPQNEVISSPGIAVQSTGQAYNFSIQWTAGAGQLHIRGLRFVQTNGPSTSHYIMQAQWIGANGSNPVAGTFINSISSLDVLGQANVPDVMPFQFYLPGNDSAPQLSVSWLPKNASTWQAKSYNPGDQVIFNLIYWQATAITSATDIPGQSALWVQLGLEPQIPLVFEQIQLMKFVETSVTPDVVGFQGFRQDMLERALRCDQDAYTSALSQVGTLFPEFRDVNASWTMASSGSWMSFLEVYEPRLRQSEGTIDTGNIAPGKQYEVITQTGESVVYNGQTYSDGQKLYGVAGVSTYTISGSPDVFQVGAYRLSRPGDIGKTGLLPAGIEYIPTAGTGTVHGWYPSYASYPTHQAVQPWMIEQGFYVADDDFQSPDGNPPLNPAPDNTPVPHPPTAVVTLISLPGDDESGVLDPNLFNGFPYRATVVVGGTAYNISSIGDVCSSTDGYHWTALSSPSLSPFVFLYAPSLSLFLIAGFQGKIFTSPDAITWTSQTSGTSGFIISGIWANGKFVLGLSNGTVLTSTNGISWSSHSGNTGGNKIGDFAFGGGTYVLVGDSGVISTSADGSTWSSRTSGFGSLLSGIIYQGGQFIAVGDAGILITSPDGVTWTPITLALANYFWSITYGGGYYVSSGAEELFADTGIFYSTNLTDWTYVASDVPGAEIGGVIYFKNTTFFGVEFNPPS